MSATRSEPTGQSQSHGEFSLEEITHTACPPAARVLICSFLRSSCISSALSRRLRLDIHLLLWWDGQRLSMLTLSGYWSPLPLATCFIWLSPFTNSLIRYLLQIPAVILDWPLKTNHAFDLTQWRKQNNELGVVRRQVCKLKIENKIGQVSFVSPHGS